MRVDSRSDSLKRWLSSLPRFPQHGAPRRSQSVRPHPELLEGRVTPSGITLLASFNSKINGGDPLGALIMDSTGNLYGTARGVPPTLTVRSSS